MADLYFYNFSYNKETWVVYLTNQVSLRDAFLTERDAHCVRDAGFARDARRHARERTHRITYHGVASSLITYLQNNLICGKIHLDKLEFAGAN